jgi:hypothetical protein
MSAAVLSFMAILFGALYAGDYVLLRYRVARNQGGLGTVTIYRYYAVEEKNRKTEYIFDHAEDQTCAHSLFPHLGYSACWYLKRHSERQTNL